MVAKVVPPEATELNPMPVSFYEKKTKAGRQFAIVKEPVARFSV